ncbi:MULTISPECIES: tail protein X [unclassified Novosphingobium]|uniref:tail protein X n=1 Tax=unclassified Novosphingobium TaxID=2644732 RepID=UPI000D328203|nr:MULTISPECIES: tail protein X [unclassified Novosphingobium]PTR05326.1 phage tail protein X [Novosphingobium sp. GV055]PUA93930.1 phage tail protein X [Novosphingobium sp. GV061]PUB11222.1 phage tail protein X [Novosphingobium sp. GV079]PUB36475.1 phage tail protein X [Novosphingobium sp. GV027]
MARTATSLQGETVDEVCWRVLGYTRTVVEQVLDLNPGLAALGPRLPAGSPIILPEASSSAATQTLETVSLWD